MFIKEYTPFVPHKASLGVFWDACNFQDQTISLLCDQEFDGLTDNQDYYLARRDHKLALLEELLFTGGLKGRRYPPGAIADYTIGFSPLRAQLVNDLF